MLVGTRDVATRTIRRTFAAAPLDDFLGSGRVDWRPERRRRADGPLRGRAGDRYRRQHPRSRDRIGVAAAAQPQHATTRWSARGRASSAPTLVNAATVSFSTFDNDDRAGRRGSAADVSRASRTDRRSACRRARRRSAFRSPTRVSLVRGSHSLRAGGEWQRVDALFDLGVFRDGRIELVEDFATFDHNGDGRVDDGDLLFAVTLRSGKPDQALVLPDADNNYVALFVQDDWRLRSRSDAESRPALRARHRRQERQPRRRDQSDRAAVPAGHAPRATSTTWARGSASTGRLETPARACTAATASTTTA